MIEHCVSAQKLYLESEHKHAQEVGYIADCLRLLTENVAKLVPQGTYYTARLHDVMHPQPVEDIDGDEIVRRIFKKAGLKGRGGGEKA